MRGAGLLSSLFGDNTVGGLANALSEFFRSDELDRQELADVSDPGRAEQSCYAVEEPGRDGERAGQFIRRSEAEYRGGSSSGFSLQCAGVRAARLMPHVLGAECRKRLGRLPGSSAAWIIPVAITLIGGFSSGSI